MIKFRPKFTVELSLLVGVSGTFSFFKNYLKRSLRLFKAIRLIQLNFSFVVIIPLLKNVHYDSDQQRCTVMWDDKNGDTNLLSITERFYYSILFSLCFLLPSIILVLFYVLLGFRVQGTDMKLRIWQKLICQVLNECHKIFGTTLRLS